MNPSLPSLEYLLECSTASLQDLELAALGRSARCLKRAKEEYLEGVAQRETAGIARWLLENRDRLMQEARRVIDAQETIPFPERKRA